MLYLEQSRLKNGMAAEGNVETDSNGDAVGMTFTIEKVDSSDYRL